MTQETTPKSQTQTEAKPKPTPIGRLTISEIDTALADNDRTIKTCSDLVKAKLASNAALPTNVLRDLSKANVHKSKLMMRRITLLIDGGDAAVMELLDKLMKIKPAKGV